MPNHARSALALNELSWIDVAAHLARDPRLIIPVGALEQHGPHLPLGTNALIGAAIAAALSERYEILQAPTMQYGVNLRTGRAYAGTATLSQKTLHRALNELLAAWEDHGVREFILITAHRHEPHLDALATLITSRARVRVVSVWDVDIADLLERQPGPLHGGEAETSVMLHLHPRLVRLERARDLELAPQALDRYLRGRLPRPPAAGAGAIGYPTAASAAKGEAICRRLLEVIGAAVFGRTAAANESDTV